MITAFAVGALAGAALTGYYVESEYREFLSALIPPPTHSVADYIPNLFPLLRKYHDETSI